MASSAVGQDLAITDVVTRLVVTSLVRHLLPQDGRRGSNPRITSSLTIPRRMTALLVPSIMIAIVLKPGVSSSAGLATGQRTR